MGDKMIFRLLLLYFEIIVIGAVRNNSTRRAPYYYDKPTYEEEYEEERPIKYFEQSDMFVFHLEFSDIPVSDTLINKSVNDCHFYEYTCDIWNKVNDKMSRGRGFYQYKIYYNVKKLLTRKHKYSHLPYAKVAKRLYESCMDEDTIEKRGLTPMQQMLTVTGGWPILMSDEEWNAKHYTWQLVHNIYFKLYSFSVLFDISYEVDYKNYGIFTIRPFSHSPLGKQLKIDIQQSPFDIKTLKQLMLNGTGEWPKYMKTIMKVVRAFAKDKGIKISEEKLRMDVIHLIEFEIKLENIIGHKKKMHKIIPTAGDKMTIAQLQEYYDVDGPRFKAKINWRHIIEIAFAQLFINVKSDSQTVLVFHKEILHDLGYLLNDTPQHVIVNYLQWHVVRIFMSNLNKEMRSIESEYYYSHDIHPSESNKETIRWLQCIEEFPLKDALSHLYVKSYISEDNIKAVSNIFIDVKKEMINYMKHSMKQNELTNLMMQKIYNISLNIDYPDQFYEQIMIDKYKMLKIYDNHFTNVLAIIRNENIIRPRNFHEFKHRDEHLYRWSLDFLTNKPNYVGQYNVIRIPAAMTHYPYFLLDQLDGAANYGAIGSIIGQLLVRSAYFYIESYFDDYDNLTLKAEIRQAFEKGSRCLFKQGHNFIQNVVNEENPEYIKLYENLVKDDIVAHFIGMQVASQVLIAKKKFSWLSYFYELLKDFYSKSETEYFTQEETFFLMNIFLMCGMKNPYENFINMTSVRMQMTDNLVNIWAFPAAFNNCPFKCVNNVRFFDEF